jgi:hypothetical protein
MYFENGSLNPASTTLADDLRQALVDGLTNAITAGFTNWSITDHDYVNGTVTSTTIENSSGFAVVLVNNTGTTNARLDMLTFLGTDWNTSTKTLNNVAFGRTSVSATPDANGYSAQSYTIPSTMPSLTSTTVSPTNMLTLYRLTATSSQTDWSIHVEDDYLYFTFKNGSATKGEWLFFGAYNSLITNPSLTDDEPFALTVSSAKSISGVHGGVAVLKSMVPSVSASQTGLTFSFRESSAPASLSSYDRYASDPDTAKVAKIFFDRGTPQDSVNGADRNISRASSDANLYGYLRGEFPDIYFGWDTNANWGDTVQVNGEVYMYAGGTHYTQAFITTPHQAGWVKIDLTGES